MAPAANKAKPYHKNNSSSSSSWSYRFVKRNADLSEKKWNIIKYKFSLSYKKWIKKL